ncbi:MAG: amidohydrolase family protein [Gammaproteobacteria bacterium]|nr:amidohydrolase family protein [Gammaproteobacteria bacterium]
MVLRTLLLSVLLVSAATAEVLLVTDVTIHTMGARGTIDNGSLLIEDGMVVAIGNDLEVPADAEVIAGDSRVITPGIFDPYSYLGIVEIDLVEQTVDGRQSGNRYTASFDVAPAVNPRSTLIPINRIEGITHAMVAPTPAYAEANLISGLGALISLGGIDDFMVKEGAALFVQLGEGGAGSTYGSRAAAVLALREALEDARDFDKHRTEYEQGRRRTYSVGRYDLEALQWVLDRDIPMVITANRASDIEQVLDLAEQEDLWIIVNGGAEAWMVAERLEAAHVPVILDPTRNLPEAFESLNATLESAARLHEAGVKIAFSTSDSHNSRNLRQLAGNAVANGLPWIEALRAITATPASLYAAFDGIGTLGVDQPANLVIWSGDPLEVTTHAERVFIDGRAISMHSRQTLLRDRYLDSDNDMPPAYRKPAP